MKNIFKKVCFPVLLITLFSCSAPGGSGVTVLLKTSSGDIKVRLYNETPIHRDNFIKLVKSGFFDGVSFHRVIKNFMIQAGDPNTKNNALVSDSLKTYTLPAEFYPNFFHKKGALAAARQGTETNPHLRSSGTQFYIVEGEILNDESLNQSEQKINNNIKQNHFINLIRETADSSLKSGHPLSDAEVQEMASIKMFQWLTSYKPYKIPQEQRQVYKTVGGTPFLDQTYTVFGEVTEGQDIVDKISQTPTDSSDKPVNDVKIIKAKIINN